jgi:hypothetical protein
MLAGWAACDARNGDAAALRTLPDLLRIRSEEAVSPTLADASPTPPGLVAGGLSGPGEATSVEMGTPTPPVWSTRTATPDEIATAALAKSSQAQPDGPTTAAGANQSLTQETVQWVATQPPGQDVTLTLVLADIPFDWSQLRGATGRARAQLIAQRQLDLQPSQSAVLAKLANLGVVATSQHWLTNAVLADVPTALVDAVAAFPEIVELQHGVDVSLAGTPGNGYTGSGPDPDHAATRT